MLSEKEELVGIIKKFAESGWVVIDDPSNMWLNNKDNNDLFETVNIELIRAIEQADQECGNCGCEFDPLYKRALVLLQNN